MSDIMYISEIDDDKYQKALKFIRLLKRCPCKSCQDEIKEIEDEYIKPREVKWTKK